MGYMQQSTSVDQNNCRHGKGSNDSIQYEQYVRLSKRTKSLMILVNCLTLDYSLEGYWSIGSESFAKLTWMPHACLPSYLPTYMYWRWWRGSSSPLQDTPPYVSVVSYSRTSILHRGTVWNNIETPPSIVR